MIKLHPNLADRVREYYTAIEQSRQVSRCRSIFGRVNHLEGANLHPTSDLATIGTVTQVSSSLVAE